MAIGRSGVGARPLVRVQSSALKIKIQEVAAVETNCIIPSAVFVNCRTEFDRYGAERAAPGSAG